MHRSAIHTFDNGVRVYDHHLLDHQRTRYRRRNVHEENEEDVFLQLLVWLPLRGVFVNVGAAIGYYIILAKMKRPDLIIHAVEPLPSHVNRLKQNVVLNGFGANEIHMHEIAIAENSNRVGQLLDSGYGSRLWDDTEPPPVRVLPVNTIPLAQFCRNLGTPIDLLQMDIQGLELAVLKGFFANSNRPLVNALLIGTHSEKLHSALIALLHQNQYNVVFECARPANQPDGIILALTLAAEIQSWKPKKR